MRTTVQKWGNSLALRIPKPFALETGIDEGVVIDLALADNRLIITPRPKSEDALARLLDQVSPDNIHGEVDTGPAVGREAW